MRVLHAWNQHRGGGGANNATRATIELEVRNGLEVEVFTRSSRDLPDTLAGRLKAGLGFAFRAGSADAFAETIERFRPDLVHAHELFPLVGPWILEVSRERGVPVVMSCVDYRLTCPVGTHLRRSSICTRCAGGREYWALIHNCRGSVGESFAVGLFGSMLGSERFSGSVRAFVAPSEFTRRWLVRHGGIDPQRVTAIAPAVILPRTPADPGAGSWIGYAGRFTAEKGVEVFLEAARRSGVPVRLARNEASLVSSPVPPELEIRTRTHEDLEAFYRGCRAIVVPSLWFETFGLVAAEAMSLGIPVIVSRGGALEELVTEGRDGLVVEPGDAGALAAAMTTLWQQPGRARSMGHEARAKAASTWGPDRHFDQIRRVYETALGGDHRGGPS